MYNFTTLTMNRLLVLFSLFFLLIPFVSAHAVSGDSDIVVDKVGIFPLFPEEGDLVSITADVYNSGIKDTNSYSSIITVAYFVDGELLEIGYLNNLEPGFSKKTQISSSPIWNSSTGYHEIKVIVDYHDTLNDKYDPPDDNFAEELLFVKSLIPTQITFDSSSQHFIPGNLDSQITISLLNSDSLEPLPNKKIILTFRDALSTLTTNVDGEISFSNSILSSTPTIIEVNFEGDSEYLSSKSSLTLYPLPNVTSSYVIMKILDSKNQYNFQDYPIEILIFQDSYQNLFKQIKPDSTNLFDSETFWISLPAEHTYFSEIYLDGRLFFVTEPQLLKKNDTILRELVIPELAQIKFNVVDQNNNPLQNFQIKNWIYSSSISNGFTDWIDVLPNTREPYVAEVILNDTVLANSDPFLIFSGERKIIDIVITESLNQNKIPTWIKTNAGWWAEGSIDDDSFVRGIQFLIEEGIMTIS